MKPPSAKLESAEDWTCDSRRSVAASAPLGCICGGPACRGVSVRTLPSCAATEWRGCIHRIVNWKRWPLVLALFCILVAPSTRTPLLYNPWGLLTAYRSSHTSREMVAEFTFTWVVEASEQALRQPGEEAYESSEPKQEAATLFGQLAHLRLPEGLMEGLQNVDWGTLVSTGAAGLEVAVSEGRQFVEGLMQSERMQHLLRNLHAQKVEDGLESLLEDLGFKEKLPAQLLRERRTLEVAFVPIFFFARERLLEKSRDQEEAALKIALEDKEMKAVVKQFENVPPARNMSTAPSTLDEMYESLREVATVLMKSRPLALSLAVRVELLTREFVDYCQSVLSAVTRYISLVGRFHRNKRALFFFAQRALPRLIKILLLLNRIEDLFLHRARSDFAERSRDFVAMQKEARQLSAHTSNLISSLSSIAHGCLAATSPRFQVEFAKALSAYDHGQDPITAFEQFLDIPRELVQEGESLPQQRQDAHGTASGNSFRQAQPQIKSQHESKMKGDTAPRGPRGERGSDETEQDIGEVSQRDEKHPNFSRLKATDYKEMMHAHLHELQEANRSPTAETAAASHVEDALIDGVRSVLPRYEGVVPEAPVHPASVATDAGSLVAGLPLEAFSSFPPRLFIALPTGTGGATPATADSSSSTHLVGHAAGARELDTSKQNASGDEGTADSASASAGGLAGVPGAGSTESTDGLQ